MRPHREAADALPLLITHHPPNPINFTSEQTWRCQRNMLLQQMNQHILLHTCAYTFETKNRAFFCFSSSRVTLHTQSLQTSMPVFLPCQVSTEATPALRHSSLQLTPRLPPQLRVSWVCTPVDRSATHPECLMQYP